VKHEDIPSQLNLSLEYKIKGKIAFKSNR